MSENTVKLYCGDCLDIMPQISEKSVDMILCDLPYGVTQNHWDCAIDIERLWSEYRRIIKDDGAIVLFGRQPFSSVLVMSNLSMYRYSIIWRKNLKTGNLNAHKRPMGSYEEILVFYKSPPVYNPQMIPRTYQQPNGNKYHSKSPNYGKQRHEYVNRQNDWLLPDDVIDYDDAYSLDALDLDGEMLYIKCVHNSQHKLHPTQKPVELLMWLIRTFTNEGFVVLDNCMGSGSTGVACKLLNRNFIGIEKEPKYFDVSDERLREKD